MTYNPLRNEATVTSVSKAAHSCPHCHGYLLIAVTVSMVDQLPVGRSVDIAPQPKAEP
jgi:hypothetical protein